VFDIKRREFILALGGATAWPLAAQAQQPASMPAVGFLHGGSPEPFASNVSAFRQGLIDTGFVEGRNVAIEYRWAHNQYDRMAVLATDLVQRHVAVIAADGTPAALAAKAATSEIPIVFMVGPDPVELGLVSSLSRPGANITGLSMFIVSLDAKRLELLRELVPTAATFALLINPKARAAEHHVKELEAVARSSGQQLITLRASEDRDIGPAFMNLVQQRADALIVAPNPFLDSRRDHLIEMAARHSVPTVYGWREFPVAGGLMSYGIKFTDVSRQLGVYVGQILKGAQPTDLPVQQPTRFELVVNLKTARSLGVTIPTSILLRADEVIE
jgi:putative tryptophan/tyrosine transport system substrate-binding protein